MRIEPRATCGFELHRVPIPAGPCRAQQEGAIADEPDAIRQPERGEGSAVAEGFLSYGPQAFRQHERGE
eukprot:7278458-Prymnesium_polylepis.1